MSNREQATDPFGIHKDQPDIPPSVEQSPAPAISSVASHEVHGRGEIPLGESQGDNGDDGAMRGLENIRTEALQRLRTAENALDAIFQRYPEARNFDVGEDDQTELAGDFYKTVLDQVAEMRSKKLDINELDQANQILKELQLATNDLESLVDALNETLGISRSKDDAAVIPLAKPKRRKDKTTDTQKKNKRKKGNGSGDGGDGEDGESTGASVNERSMAVLRMVRPQVRVAQPEETPTKEDTVPTDQVAEESISTRARDYSEAEIKGAWDQLPRNREGIAQKIALVQEQIDRVEELAGKIYEMRSEERLANQLSHEIHVDQSGRKRADETPEEYTDRKKSMIRSLIQPNVLARLRDRLSGIQERSQTDTVTPQDRTTLMVNHLDLHQLLSALEKIEEEAREEREREVPMPRQEKAERGEAQGSTQEQPEKRVPFRKRLSQAREWVAEWKLLVQQSGITAGNLRSLVASRIGKKNILNIDNFSNQLDEQEAAHQWKTGEQAKVDKRKAIYLIEKLEEIMPVARAVVTGLAQENDSTPVVKQTVASAPQRENIHSPGGEHGSNLEDHKATLESKDKKVKALAEMLDRWDALVAEIEQLEGKTELENLITQKFGNIKWRAVHAKTWKNLEAIEVGTYQKDRDEFFDEHHPVYFDMLRYAERLKNFLEKKERRLRELQELAQKFLQLYNDFFSAEYPKGQSSHEHIGKSSKSDVVHLKTRLPIDEDEAVITSRRELLRKAIHDIYADFHLTYSLEKAQAKASARGVDGKKDFELYRNHLHNLCNQLEAQIEVVRGKDSRHLSQGRSPEGATDQKRERKVKQERDQPVSPKPDVLPKESRTELSPQELTQLSIEIVSVVKALIQELNTGLASEHDHDKRRKGLVEIYYPEIDKLLAQVEARIKLDDNKRIQLTLFLKKLAETV